MSGFSLFCCKWGPASLNFRPLAVHITAFREVSLPAPCGQKRFTETPRTAKILRTVILSGGGVLFAAGVEGPLLGSILVR